MPEPTKRLETRNLRVVVVSEAFCEGVVIDLQLCDLQRGGEGGRVKQWSLLR